MLEETNQRHNYLIKPEIEIEVVLPQNFEEAENFVKFYKEIKNAILKEDLKKLNNILLEVSDNHKKFLAGLRYISDFKIDSKNRENLIKCYDLFVENFEKEIEKQELAEKTKEEINLIITSVYNKTLQLFSGQAEKKETADFNDLLTLFEQKKFLLIEQEKKLENSISANVSLYEKLCEVLDEEPVLLEDEEVSIEKIIKENERLASIIDNNKENIREIKRIIGNQEKDQDCSKTCVLVLQLKEDYNKALFREKSLKQDLKLYSKSYRDLLVDFVKEIKNNEKLQEDNQVLQDQIKELNNTINSLGDKDKKISELEKIHLKKIDFNKKITDKFKSKVRDLFNKMKLKNQELEKENEGLVKTKERGELYQERVRKLFDKKKEKISELKKEREKLERIGILKSEIQSLASKTSKFFSKKKFLVEINKLLENEDDFMKEELADYINMLIEINQNNSRLRKENENLRKGK
jgi:hypothetical protein